MVSNFALAARVVNGVFVVFDSYLYCLQTYFKPRLRISAPGSNPDSHKSENRAEPSTNPPPSANLRTDSITGENLAMTPVRR